MTLRLSIIIPVLNEASLIADAIARAAELRPAEVIVVDGGSTDGTQEAAAGLNCRVLLSSRGRARQQNLGAAAATGNVLLFLHADCWLAPEARSQIECVFNSPRLVGGAFWQSIDASGLIYRGLEIGNALRACCARMAYGDQGLLIRHEIFQKLGGFADVRLMEDVLFMRRLRLLGRLAFLPGPLHVSARRWQKRGAIRQTLRNWLLLSGERLGIDPDHLAPFYR